MLDSDQPADAEHQEFTVSEHEKPAAIEGTVNSSIDFEAKPTVGIDAAAANLPPTDTPISQGTASQVVAEKKKAKIRWPQKTTLMVAFVILLNAGLATGGVYLYRQSSKTKPLQHVSSKPADSIPVSVSPASAPIKSEATKLHYTAEALKAEFDYPSDWHISSNGTDQYITIESPAIQLRDINGKIGDAKVVIEMSGKYSEDNFITKDAQVLNTSEKLTYDNPTAAQRKETNLTYTQFAGDDNPKSISASFISGNLAYLKGSKVGSQNFNSVNPFIVVYIQSCLKGCQSFGYAGVSYDDFQSNPMLSKAKDIIKSLRLN